MKVIKNKIEIFSINNMVKISIFAAMAGLLALFKFPIPIAPTFMTVDFGDVATLLSGFTLGPVLGGITVILKNLINLMLNGTTTAYVGELSNTIVGVTFVVISSLIYWRKKTRKAAILGLVFGIIGMSFIATFSNYFVIFPIYAKIFHIPVDGFVKFVPKSYNIVKNYYDLMVLSVLPFNIVKGTLNAIVTFLVYKKISKAMKKI